MAVRTDPLSLRDRARKQPAWPDWPADHGRIERLLRPRSIAIVGASPNRSYVSVIWRNLIAHGFRGEVYPVNPNYDEIDGRRCWNSLTDIPGPVDVAVIGVPAKTMPPVLEQASAKGVAALDVITSGFGEMLDDALAAERDAELRAFTSRTGVRIVGPNCFGFLSSPERVFAYPGTYENATAGPVALVLQSGQIVVSLLRPCYDRGIGFQYVVTTGNELDFESADFIRYFVEDPQTRVIGCYLEQFRTPAKLREVAELAAGAGKPIIVVKTGRSVAAKQAVRAHTGALAGSDEVIDAALRQWGVIRVRDIDEMIEALAVSHSRRLPGGNRVGAITLSGAACGMLHDLAEQTGVTFPPLEPEIEAELKPALPDYVNVGNPLDITGIGAMRPEIFTSGVDALAKASNLDVIVYLRGVPSKIDAQGEVAKAWLRASAQHPDKVFLLLSIAGGMLHEAQDSSMPSLEPVGELEGVPFLQGCTPGLSAIGALARYAEFLRQREQPGAPTGIDLDPAAARRARELITACGNRPLTEREGKAVLAEYGIPTAREMLATSLGQAREAARLIGYPVALKLESPGLVHKTEAGAVLLDVAGEDQLEHGYALILERARLHEPAAHIAGVLVQEMVPQGHELILGMTRDAQFGPVVAVGLGGVFTEVLRDVALGIPPLSEWDAHHMLDALRAAPVLRGTRGQPPVDHRTLVDVLLRFSQLTLDVADLVQDIDVNPLIISGRDTKAVDCLIVPRAEDT